MNFVYWFIRPALKTVEDKLHIKIYMVAHWRFELQESIKYGVPSGVRTLDSSIKSAVLYLLS